MTCRTRTKPVELAKAKQGWAGSPTVAGYFMWAKTKRTHDPVVIKQGGSQ